MICETQDQDEWVQLLFNDEDIKDTDIGDTQRADSTSAISRVKNVKIITMSFNV
jgi:hypothetical protein